MSGQVSSKAKKGTEKREHSKKEIVFFKVCTNLLIYLPHPLILFIIFLFLTSNTVIGSK